MQRLLMEKTFKQLQNEWYEILKREGFEDIEDINSSKEYLKTWHSIRFKANNKNLKSVREYYDTAQEFLLKFEFKCEEDRIIWKLHSEGVSFRKISKALKLLNVVKEKSMIGKIIGKLREIMRSDEWKVESQKYLKKIS